MPTFCYYLRYLLLLIPLLAIVVAHTAVLADWKAQVLSFLLQQHLQNPKTYRKHDLKWKPSHLGATYFRFRPQGAAQMMNERVRGIQNKIKYLLLENIMKKT